MDEAICNSIEFFETIFFNSFVPEVTKYGYLATQEFPFRREMVNKTICIICHYRMKIVYQQCYGGTKKSRIRKKLINKTIKKYKYK